MRVALVATALILPLVTAAVLADPGKDESGHRSRERAAHYQEAEHEYWKRQEESAREARKRREEHAREQRKREEEWRREERKRALEWEREHGHTYREYLSYPTYVPYVVEPVYPPEGITITRDGIEVWLTL